MKVGAAITKEDRIEQRDYSLPDFDENILTKLAIYLLSI
jgi:hypothetical protein